MYANTSGSLYEVDPENGSMTYVGDFQENGVPVDHFEDIAIDLSGHMYGGTGEYMYLINPNTAEVRAICPFEIDTTALAFTSDGELIIGVDTALYTFDVVTCAIDVLLANSYYETSGDIVGLPDGYLYWSVRGGDSDKLIKVNPNNGAEEWVGDIGENRLYGMGYSNDKLYGFSGSGVIVEIDPQTGWSTFMKQANNLSWCGVRRPIQCFGTESSKIGAIIQKLRHITTKINIGFVLEGVMSWRFATATLLFTALGCGSDTVTPGNQSFGDFSDWAEGIEGFASAPTGTTDTGGSGSSINTFDGAYAGLYNYPSQVPDIRVLLRILHCKLSLRMVR